MQKHRARRVRSLMWSVKIDGGEHVWPTEDIAGFNANELILDFFDQCS
ncbi:MAG: hypothetical protein K6E72_03655 [Saccharofermentans sp.]|nr:hypothetical protein [Saccharofermentans sp.]